MTARPAHRTLRDQLRGWNPGQVATLLVRRPDLAHPQPPADVAELAQRAQQRPSIDLAISATTLPENRLLQVLVCCRPEVPLDELARALPEGVGLDDVEDVLAGLEAAAVAWRHGGRVHSSGALRQAMPTTLGPPLHLLAGEQNVEYLRSAIKAVRAALDAQRFRGALPDRASGPEGRPARKAELVEELSSLLAAPGVVGAVLEAAPPDAATLASAQAEGSPLVELDHYLYFSTYGPARYQRELPVYWLFERALLLPYRDDLAAQPREVGVALRGGRPVADLALDQPPLPTTTSSPDRVDADGATAAVRTLDRLSDLLERWGETPAKTLKSGGLGATVMKQTAAALETDLEEATRLVELAHLAGLVETTTVSARQQRRVVYESFVEPTPAATAWLGRPVAERWRQLATAWLRAEHWPSAPGRKGTGSGSSSSNSSNKVVPVLSLQYAASAPELRRRVLDTLAGLAPGEVTTADALASRVYWVAPQPWLGTGLPVDRPAGAIAWVYAEAELLGVLAHGSLTSFGRALLAGQARRAEQALEAARPEPVTTFTLQGDLTATVVGALERSVALELRLLADVESTGAATTLRFSDASLRRALDAGRDAEGILAFLETHAARGVPQALAYLIADVARRHGHLQVGSAASFVTSEDPAVLADACSHRRTRKLALRLLAPTVAVSPKPSTTVMDGLRDAGFLPTGEGGPGGSVSVAAADAPSGEGRRHPGGERERGSGAELPEPFRPRRGHRASPPTLDPRRAASLAEAILAGPSPEATTSPAPGSPGKARNTTARPSTGPPAAPLPFPGSPFFDEGDGDEAPADLRELFEWARDRARVLAVSLGDEDHRAPPIIIAVTGGGPDGIVGIDLEQGAVTSVLVEQVGVAMDLGPIDELANVTPLAAARPRPGRHRR